MSSRAHVLVVVVTASCVLFVVRRLRRHQLPTKYAVVWLLACAVLVVLAASPSLLDDVSEWLGVSYPPATFFLGAITLLFLVVIHFSYELSRLDERTRVLAEELAVLRAGQPSDGPSAQSPAGNRNPDDGQDGEGRGSSTTSRS